MVATCCKPSSVAGVVWMNMNHREVWIKPDHKKGDCLIKTVPCAYVLPLSHNTRALKSRKTEARRVVRRCRAEGSGFESHERTLPFSPQSRNNCCYNVPILCLVEPIHCNCERIYLIVCLLYFHFRKYNEEKELYFYKKHNLVFNWVLIEAYSNFPKPCLCKPRNNQDF